MSAFLRLESDAELRARVLYVGGDGERWTREITEATGLKLDQWAWSFNLRRRQVKP